MLDRYQFLSKRKQWEIYNAWEVKEFKAFYNGNEASKALNWFYTAWELARQLNPTWAEKRIDPDKIKRLQKTKVVLAHLEKPGGIDDGCHGK